jgi:hypothetical protein
VVVVPIWTLAIAAVGGIVVGLIVGRLLPRPRAAEAPASAPPSDTAPLPEAAVTEEVLELVTAPPESEATAEEEPAEGEVPRIGMEDVVTELERRYEGRRAEEEKERARRKRDREPPASR